MADHPSNSNSGTPLKPGLPGSPDEQPAAAEPLPAQVQLGLQSVYHHVPEVPAGYDQQVLSAAAQVIAAAGQPKTASRQSPAREHRRVRLPLAAGLAASLALVVGTWVLLSSTGGLGRPMVTGSGAESRAVKDGTTLIGKATTRDATAFGRGAGSGGAAQKEAAVTPAADAMSSADADGSGGPRQASGTAATSQFGEPTSSGQQPATNSTAALSEAAASTAGLAASAESPPASASQSRLVQAPVTAVQQRPAAGSQTPGGATQVPTARSETGDAAPPEPTPSGAATGQRAVPQAPVAAPAAAKGGAQPGAHSGAPAAGATAGTTGATLPPNVQNAAPTLDQGAAKRADEPAAKPGGAAKEKAEVQALDVVDAFRLAWIVSAEAVAVKRPNNDPPLAQPWIGSARRDINADGGVNQTDVEALLRELVKVPAVAPTADDASPAEVHFDVILDTGQSPLAGYQIEIIGQGKAVRVVSVVAGTSVAFSEAPKYDGVSLGLALGYGDSRRVMNLDARDRNAVELKSGAIPHELEGSKPLRLAAVSLKPAAELPLGQVTVARVGWRTADGAEPVMAIKLLAAVDATGERIKPTVKLQRVKPTLK